MFNETLKQALETCTANPKDVTFRIQDLIMPEHDHANIEINAMREREGNYVK